MVSPPALIYMGEDKYESETVQLFFALCTPGSISLCVALIVYALRVVEYIYHRVFCMYLFRRGATQMGISGRRVVRIYKCNSVGFTYFHEVLV